MGTRIHLSDTAAGEPHEMTASRLVTKGRCRGNVVAVIASSVDLQRAMRLRQLPDFFELRLDAFRDAAEEVLSAVPKLKRPIIVTARHPAEDGQNRLRATKRRDLLLRFLPVAAFVDVELRSVAQLQPVLDAARVLHVRCILSHHDLVRTPAIDQLKRLASIALQNDADIFKLATRVNDERQAARLLDFLRTSKTLMPLAVMSIGPDTRQLRLLLARQGSALNYTHLGSAQAEGQWSLSDFRKALHRDR